MDRSPATLAEWTRLLRGYAAVMAGARKTGTCDAVGQARVVQTLLSGYQKTWNAWAENQRGCADDFNLLEVLGVANDELRHSAVLEWLLDHRLDHAGTHAQGNLGFRFFAEELNFPHFPPAYADSDYWVRREVVGEEARVDIEVAARGKFIIHIENKLWAAEGDLQTRREGRDLSRRAKQLGVPPEHVHPLFLTLDGRAAANPDFRAVQWSQIARVLERFADECQPPEVGLFAAHCARSLRKVSRTETEPVEFANYE